MLSLALPPALQANAMLKLAAEKGIKPWSESHASILWIRRSADASLFASWLSVQEMPMSKAGEGIRMVDEGSVRYRCVRLVSCSPRRQLAHRIFLACQSSVVLSNDIDK